MHRLQLVRSLPSKFGARAKYFLMRRKLLESKLIRLIVMIRFGIVGLQQHYYIINNRSMLVSFFFFAPAFLSIQIRIIDFCLVSCVLVVISFPCLLCAVMQADPVLCASFCVHSVLKHRQAAVIWADDRNGLYYNLCGAAKFYSFHEWKKKNDSNIACKLASIRWWCLLLLATCNL